RPVLARRQKTLRAIDASIAALTTTLENLVELGSPRGLLTATAQERRGARAAGGGPRRAGAGGGGPGRGGPPPPEGAAAGAAGGGRWRRWWRGWRAMCCRASRWTWRWSRRASRSCGHGITRRWRR